MRKKGQALVEYLILVSMIAVASISVVTVVAQNLKARYAGISSALKGKKPDQVLEEASLESYQLRDFSDYSEGAVKP